LSFNAIYSLQSALNQQAQQEAVFPLVPPAECTFGGVAFCSTPLVVDTGKSVSNAVDFTTIYFTLSGSRRISRRLSINGSAVYWQQELGGAFQKTRSQAFQVSIGFTWNFDPIPL
jgi:hypothetical protein